MTDDRSRRPRLRFATEVLVLQLAVVVAVVALTSAVFVRIEVTRLERAAEGTALAIAQSVAAQSDVRAAVARLSVDGTDLDPAVLADGPVQRAALAAQRRTGALFVVVTDDRGIRLAHPDTDRIGEMVSTSPDAALAGRETVSWARGTLGESARAKVPVSAPVAGGAETSRASRQSAVVGEVSVGFNRARVYDTLVEDSVPVIGAGLAAVLLAVIASVLIRRRLVRLTLGLQPEELVTLVQNQQAVLGGVGEGVIAIGPSAVVTVCNPEAVRLLGLADPVGRPVASLDLPAPLGSMLDVTTAAPASATIVAGHRVLLVDVRTVFRDGRDLGRVAVLRDRTDVEALTRRLDAVGAMSTALRAQRHEFANRLHAISGLLDIGETTRAGAYLADVQERGPLRYPVQHADRLTEPYLQAFLGAKGVEAAERGVLLRIGAETLVQGTITDPGDVTTVLGNLVDNAVSAALGSDERSRDGGSPWVEVEVLDDGATLHLSVMDSGPGVPDDAADSLFVRGQAAPASEDVSQVHGLGIGLPLSREIARRHGGDVWLASPGGADHGAVFCARLEGVVS
ncbi:sensor histidine kinase [Curtobacterium flaccumfaciens pv. flaccumfaciens]|uniref:sensor histidine kinase n=1 Tax=Curtobacterium flaccumfaciens TaxID=2035 RepID=UPI001AD9F84C|nr:sensor histidine kinase [Curtobacterium flaccumfaciens]MBO9048175.1 sensor histidine kinase [Curtobacterium flaccumfaciens pv. flaccumfaciens]MBO9058102.1 sensor histidine kinase [Curtobacterium flaccumfaciens pv. flaccumfaciens]QTR90242.1 sensor histidine kinase [Curtobacterium flaccumfaciens pv. flaccumfaciens]QVG65515.1 sensor histidine kinase [Curtobacterium flaccumfaciens pv. flaccumfaciens]